MATTTEARTHDWRAKSLELAAMLLIDDPRLNNEKNRRRLANQISEAIEEFFWEREQYLESKRDLT